MAWTIKAKVCRHCKRQLRRNNKSGLCRNCWFKNKYDHEKVKLKMEREVKEMDDKYAIETLKLVESCNDKCGACKENVKSVIKYLEEKNELL